MSSPAPLQYTTAQSEQPKPARWALIIPLLLLGVAAWLSIGKAIIDWPNQIPALMCGGAVLILMLVPTVRKISVEGLRIAELKLQNHLALTALIIAILSAAYFAFTAIRQGREESGRPEQYVSPPTPMTKLVTSNSRGCPSGVFAATENDPRYVPEP